MFRRQNQEADEDVAVDATLEFDLGWVEASIEAYLKNPSVTLRNQLLTGLERLDQQIDDSDAYESGIIGSAAIGFSDKGSVIGETSGHSAAREVPESVLQAQTALIKAAKREVAAPMPDTFADLTAAHQALVVALSTEPPTHWFSVRKVEQGTVLEHRNGLQCRRTLPGSCARMSQTLNRISAVGAMNGRLVHCL